MVFSIIYSFQVENIVKSSQTEKWKLPDGSLEKMTLLSWATNLVLLMLRSKVSFSLVKNKTKIIYTCLLNKLCMILWVLWYCQMAHQERFYIWTTLWTGIPPPKNWQKWMCLEILCFWSPCFLSEGYSLMFFFSGKGPVDAPPPL